MNVLENEHSGLDQLTAAWLFVSWGESAAIALPVPRRACLGLTRAVLAGLDRWWLLAGDDPAVAVWLADHEQRTVSKSVARHRSIPTQDAFGRLDVGQGLDATGLVFLRAGRDLDRHADPTAAAIARLAESLLIGGRPPADHVAVSSLVWEAFTSQASHAVKLGGDDLSAVRRQRGQEWLAGLKAGALHGSGAIQDLYGMPGGSPVATVSSEPPLESLVLGEAIGIAARQQMEASRFDEAVAKARLESMRELAYGAGHEINNPLANIATRAQSLLLEEKDPERRKRLATIVDQSFRARDMIGGLMLFARPPRPQRASVDICSLVGAVVESIRALAAGRGVRLEYSPPPTPINAFVDRAQIEEAVRAIAVNALEAVEDGGRVALAACPCQADSGLCEISVVDNGRGMDAATMRRAFDPFFSGREAGRGAGLGLSKAWRFVECSGGDVVLESRLGHGTHVVVSLPTVGEAS